MLKNTEIAGVTVYEPPRYEDNRGFFSPALCFRSLDKAGLSSNFLRINNSLSLHQKTLRGLHLQLPPAAEAKVIRVISGSIWDVVLDLRSNSATYGQHIGIELSAETRHWLHIPQGCAHGFLTLEPNTEVLYLSTADYEPQLERGVRWNDPQYSIQWPAVPEHISEKDSSLPLTTTESPLVVHV